MLNELPKFEENIAQQKNIIVYGESTRLGEARLKQARFFVVQGYPDNAMQAVRKARALYEKADDKKGLKEVLKLVESLAKSG